MPVQKTELRLSYQYKKRLFANDSNPVTVIWGNL